MAHADARTCLMTASEEIHKESILLIFLAVVSVIYCKDRQLMFKSRTMSAWYGWTYSQTTAQIE